jgi:drug/metabolite transporter (DMT)-like permease
MDILFALLSALFLSISDILSKYSLDNGISNFEYIFWSHGIIYLACIILLLIYLAFNPLKLLLNKDTIKDILKIKFNNTRYAILLSGVFGFLALITIIYTFKISKNIGYTVAVISTTCLFSLIFSYIFLGAPINYKGVMGMIFILIGVYLIGNCSNKSLSNP